MAIDTQIVMAGIMLIAVGLVASLGFAKAVKGGTRYGMQIGGALVAVLGLVIIASGSTGIGMPFAIGGAQVTVNQAGAVAGVIDPQATTKVTFTALNSLNSSGTEYLTPTVYIFDEKGNYVTQVSVPAAIDGGNWTGATYGKKYDWVTLSTSNALQTAKGSFVGDSQATVQVAMPQMGATTFRAYDRDLSGFMYDAADADTGYEASGIAFTGSTNNLTNTTVGTDGILRIRLDALQTATDTTSGDVGNYFAIDADANNWTAKDAAVYVNGVKLVLAQEGSVIGLSQLQSDGYEAVFVLPTPAVQGARTTEITVDLQAASGVNPTADVKFALAKAGTLAALNDAQKLTTGIVKSDGRSYVHALQTASIVIE